VSVLIAVLAVIVLGALFWLTNTSIPLRRTIKPILNQLVAVGVIVWPILNWTVVIGVIVWLLFGFGVIGSSSAQVAGAK